MTKEQEEVFLRWLGENVKAHGASPVNVAYETIRAFMAEWRKEITTIPDYTEAPNIAMEALGERFGLEREEHHEETDTGGPDTTDTKGG